VRARLDGAAVPTSTSTAARATAGQGRALPGGPRLPLSSISLKAGGQGLNLTAADYVFLLDPWWNPAVESQAIDRAHRIGQTRAVFAYRLIAKDTVEERIQDLQATSAPWPKAVFAGGTGAEGALAALTREELERLLA
jgi:SNF2 family DNA or RNA helicase